jgi:hypothetical protein
MSKTLQKPRKKQPSLQSLQKELIQLRERVEDLEDLYELREAVERNAGKPGIPWEQVKAELELD